MMNFEDFYNIALYANENWNKGKFSHREEACNAHCYYSDYEYSKANNTISTTIKTLCENLYEDLQNMSEDDADYSNVHWWLHLIAHGLGYTFDNDCVPFWN